MLFTELTEELSNALHEDVWWDGDAMYVSIGSTRIYIEYVAEGDGLYLYAHLAEMAREDLRDVGATLLEAGLFGMETDGSAVFSYDDDAGRLVLWEKCVLGDMDFNLFQQRYIGFMATVDEWRKRLANEATCAPSDLANFA